MAKGSAPRQHGVLLVGHGTREPQGTDEFFALADRLKERCPHPVAASLLEFQSPTIAEGWRTLVDAGVDHIHVSPLLLFAAGHAKSDIPDEIQRAASGTPGITHDQSRPLSRAPSLVHWVQTRLTDTLRDVSAPLERTALLMVGRGSRDPCARTDMFVLSELMRHRIRVASVDTAFYAMTTPTLPDMLDQIASRHDIDAVVVHPHLLFQGRLFAAIDRQCREAAQRHDGTSIILSPYLGPVDAIADAIAHRIAMPSQPCLTFSGSR